MPESRLAIMDRFRKKVGRPLESLAVNGRPEQHLAPAQEKVVCFAVGRFAGIEPRGFAQAQFDLQSVNDPPRDLVLDGEKVAQFAIEAVGPEVSTRFRVDQLRGDPQPVASAADAPF